MSNSIEKQNESWRKIIESSRLGTWDWNLETGEVVFNDFWAWLLGYDPKEIEPHYTSWKKLLYEEDVEEVEKTLVANLSGQSDFYDSFHRLKTKESSYFWVHARGMVVERNDKGEATRHMGTTHVVEEYKQEEFSQKRQAEPDAVKAAVVTYNHYLNNKLTVVDYALDKMKDSVSATDKKFVESAKKNLEDVFTVLRKMSSDADEKEIDFIQYYEDIKMLKI